MPKLLPGAIRYRRMGQFRQVFGIFEFLEHSIMADNFEMGFH